MHPGPRLALALLASVFGGPPQSPASAPSTDVAVPKGAITPEEIRDLVRRLAADDLEGRGSGEAGGARAGEFLAAQMQSRGLAAAGDDGKFFQTFEREGMKLRNLAGLVRGTDPKKRDEYLVLGAHYDHVGFGRAGVGMGGSGEIHHGADDNASGTSAVLAVARAVAAAPLARSVLFLLFDGEERGLWGSAHYVKHPLVPIESTNAMVNLDMIGRSYDGYLFIGGVGTSPAWEDVLAKALKVEGKAFRDVERHKGGHGPSDHDSFYGVGVPVLFLFTNVHRDYHQPRDTWDKLRYKPAAAIARTAHEMLKALAARPGRIPFDRSDAVALPRSFDPINAAVFQRVTAMQRRLGGTLEPGPGGAPRFKDVEPAGMRAGIEKGDVVLAIATGAPKKGAEKWVDVKDVEALRVEVERLEPGARVVLRVRRGAETLSIATAIGDVPEWKLGPAKDGGDLADKPAAGDAKPSR